MRVVLQRVTRAAVRVEGDEVGAIGAGLLALVGIGAGDDAAAARRLAAKTAGLRVFGPPRASVAVGEAGGAVLVVSQFTLYADTSRGNRPSWSAAAPAELAEDLAEDLVEVFARELEERGLEVARGIFGAHMVVELTNDGPVTILLTTDTEGD